MFNSLQLGRSLSNIPFHGIGRHGRKADASPLSAMLGLKSQNSTPRHQGFVYMPRMLSKFKLPRTLSKFESLFSDEVIPQRLQTIALTRRPFRVVDEVHILLCVSRNFKLDNQVIHIRMPPSAEK